MTHTDKILQALPIPDTNREIITLERTYKATEPTTETEPPINLETDYEDLVKRVSPGTRIPTLYNAIQRLQSGNTNEETVTISYSFPKAGVISEGNFTVPQRDANKKIVRDENGAILWTTQIRELEVKAWENFPLVLDQVKKAFTNIQTIFETDVPGLKLNFVNNGRETIDTKITYGEYVDIIPGTGNRGDIKIYLVDIPDFDRITNPHVGDFAALGYDIHLGEIGVKTDKGLSVTLDWNNPFYNDTDCPKNGQSYLWVFTHEFAHVVGSLGHKQTFKGEKVTIDNLSTISNYGFTGPYEAFWGNILNDTFLRVGFATVYDYNLDHLNFNV